MRLICKTLSIRSKFCYNRSASRDFDGFIEEVAKCESYYLAKMSFVNSNFQNGEVMSTLRRFWITTAFSFSILILQGCSTTQLVARTFVKTQPEVTLHLKDYE